MEEKEESEESERHEEGEEDEKLDQLSQEDKPLVNVDAREVHQVVVATPSQEQKADKLEKVDYIDRRPLKAGSARIDARQSLKEVIHAREEMNGQLIDLHHRFLAIKPRTLRNPTYRVMLKKYCSMLESRISLEREYLDLDESADDKILRMLQAHHKKLTKH